MNQFNALSGEKLTITTQEWNRKPPAAHFKSSASPSKTSHVVSAIMERINHHAIDIGDVEFHPSEFLVEYNY